MKDRFLVVAVGAIVCAAEIESVGDSRLRRSGIGGTQRLVFGRYVRQNARQNSAVARIWREPDAILIS